MNEVHGDRSKGAQESNRQVANPGSIRHQLVKDRLDCCRRRARQKRLTRRKGQLITYSRKPEAALLFQKQGVLLAQTHGGSMRQKPQKSKPAGLPASSDTGIDG